MSSFASHPSANAWIEFVSSRFDLVNKAAETSPARTGLTGAAARTALLDLEMEIFQHPDFLAFAKKKRNDGRPACNLPPEVVARILWFTQSRRIENSSYVSGLTTRWLLLSHVCSKWRQVALSSPELWCCLSCRDYPARVVPEILSRSQEQNLELVFKRTRSTKERSLSTALRDTYMSAPVCQRIRTLHIDETPACFEASRWPALLRNSMPQLEFIEISLLDIPRNAVVILPPDIGSTPPPSPSWIRLYKCLLPLTSPLFNINMQHLEICLWTDVPHSLISSLAHFIDAFQRMPALKELILDNAFPNFIGGFEEDVIYLEHLEVLTLSARSQNVMNCLSMLLLLKLPRTLCCSIYLNGDDGETDADLMRRAITHVFQTPVAPPQSLHIGDRVLSTVSSSQVTALTDMNMAIDKMDTDMLPEERRVISETTDELVRHLSCVTMSALRHVTVTADVMRATPGIDSWGAMFSSAIQVHELVLDFTPPLLSFLHALMVRDISLAPDSQTSMSVFPALETLTLHDEYSNEDEDNLRLSVDDANSIQLQFALLELVRKRHDCGAPLKQLIVEDNILNDTLLRKIEEVVQVEVITLTAYV